MLAQWLRERDQLKREERIERIRESGRGIRGMEGLVRTDADCPARGPAV